jgi:hypothetical protein
MASPCPPRRCRCCCPRAQPQQTAGSQAGSNLHAVDYQNMGQMVSTAGTAWAILLARLPAAVHCCRHCRRLLPWLMSTSLSRVTIQASASPTVYSNWRKAGTWLLGTSSKPHLRRRCSGQGKPGIRGQAVGRRLVAWAAIAGMHPACSWHIAEALPADGSHTLLVQRRAAAGGGEEERGLACLRHQAAHQLGAHPLPPAGWTECCVQEVCFMYA